MAKSIDLQSMGTPAIVSKLARGDLLSDESCFSDHDVQNPNSHKGRILLEKSPKSIRVNAGGGIAVMGPGLRHPNQIWQAGLLQ